MAKVDLYPDFRQFLESLNSAGVKYLLVGGYAVIFYGYRRATDDMDVWIAIDPENTEKVSKVLQSYGGFLSHEVLPHMFRQPGKVFIFGREPVRVDVLTGPSGVDFAECYARRNVVDFDGIRVPLISFDDLKRNKAASGRDKDMADLRNLPPSWPWERPRSRASGKGKPRRRR